MNAEVIALVGLGVLVVLLIALVTLWAFQTANRLDRLHVRCELSWQALDSALARRAVVARAVAAQAERDAGSAVARRLVGLADVAERAPRDQRETAENELSAALSEVDSTQLPSAMVAELADSETRVLLARRFHNDAVRDTLALRERPAVRLLRLRGHAEAPSYFEIAERAQGGARIGAQDSAELRTSARVVLLDEAGKVLLLHGSDPAAKGTALGAAPRWWFTVGGQALESEALTATASRELAEETGLRVPADRMIGPIWRRDALIDFNGSVMRSQEFYFVHCTRQFDPSMDGRTALERNYIHGHRWCDAAEIAELAGSGETVYPLQLGELLGTAIAVAGGEPVPEPVAIQ